MGFSVEDILEFNPEMATVPALTEPSDVVPVAESRPRSPRGRVVGETCPKCGGDGKWRPEDGGPPKGPCFQCAGTGRTVSKEESDKFYRSQMEKRGKPVQSSLPPATLDASPLPVAAGADVARKVAIADAVLGLSSPAGLPETVRTALLAYYMGGR